MSLICIDAAQVRSTLSPAACIAVVRKAMIALSRGQAQQPLRSILDLDGGDLLGLMPGRLGEDCFGAKLISVYPHNAERGQPSHQGLVALFDRASGAPLAVVDAQAITALRTAAASAVATDALARQDAQVLALLGYGEQAETHLIALAQVRRLREVRIWGRSRDKAEAFIGRMRLQVALAPLALRYCDSVAAAVDAADMVCTLTHASEPILEGTMLAPGCHVNLVGSGRPGPVEVDSALVCRARFFADHRESVLKQGAEFLRAKAAGLVDDSHVLGEIGQVLAADLPGRVAADDITVYKSLGSIVQDLAAARYVYRRLAGLDSSR
ncbi:ornithine cyclodeaminase [Tahibacter aquaticus]|uniref:Ornithine cyclodeaminase n=1 Tax=Tahibacter aquaticus TaxID=520092 RepID=A0A4R6YN27_9GAMM|nr:ornithine cyclodeaminase family protein [Tahibacter aquaticus]TDR38930.1 ornithine cyclodeaminase [Tahibacter aquaticus]